MKQETGQKHSGWYTCCVALAALGMLLVVLAVMIAREVNGGIWAALGALFWGSPLAGNGETTFASMGLVANLHARVLWSAQAFLYGLGLLVLAVPGVLKDPPRRWLLWLGLCVAGAGTVFLLACAFVWGAGFSRWWLLLFAALLVPYIVLAARQLRAGNLDETPAGLPKTGLPSNR